MKEKFASASMQNSILFTLFLPVEAGEPDRQETVRMVYLIGNLEEKFFGRDSIGLPIEGISEAGNREHLSAREVFHQGLVKN